MTVKPHAATTAPVPLDRDSSFPQEFDIAVDRTDAYAKFFRRITKDEQLIRFEPIVLKNSVLGPER